MFTPIIGTLAYVVRAVTPGRYSHPAPSVEDMYRPDIRGVGTGRGNAQRRQDLEALEQRAIGGRGQVAEGVADEGLEAGHAGLEQGLELVDALVAQQAVDAEVAVRRLGGLLLDA